MAKKKGSNTGIPGLSFSWKRATGVTRLKQQVAKATGIPTTKAGRQRKLDRMIARGIGVPSVNASSKRQAGQTAGCASMILFGLLLAVSLSVFTSCAANTLAQSKVQYDFKMTKPKPSADLAYEDAFIKVNFAILDKIMFKLINKTDKPIEIEWAKASYTDIDSRAHRIIHQGVRFIEKDKAPPSTVIPPSANILDTIIPADYISLDGNAWKTDPLFESFDNAVGKPFGLFLPIKINGVVKNYSFRFVMERIEQKTSQ